MTAFLYFTFFFFISFFSFPGLQSVFAAAAPSPSPPPAACSLAFPAGSTPPAGYGASFNVFSPSELLLSATCSGQNATLTVGSSDMQNYTYQTGYYWDGNQWQSYTLTGGSPNGGWLTGKGTASIPLTPPNTFFVGYTCHWNGTTWQCGCTDTACTTPAWQVQGITSSQGTNPGSGGNPGACNPNQNVLTTGDAEKDKYDCIIIEVAEKFGYPAPRFIKAEIGVESDWDIFSISENTPCNGPQPGWTSEESRSFGLLKITAGCKEAPDGMLPNGHPNLTQDQSDPLWASSVFNPVINLTDGVQAIMKVFNEAKQSYSGCTDFQYEKMAAAIYLGSEITGCDQYTGNAPASAYIENILKEYNDCAAKGNWPSLQ